MKALKFKMYSSFIAGQVFLLLGLFLFISSNDKTVSHFLIFAGLVSNAIALLILFIFRKNSLMNKN